MQPRSNVSYIWQERNASLPYMTGVSLHSHTSLSIESLSFVHTMCTGVPMVGAVVAHYDRKSRKKHGVALDFDAAHWRPPLVPRMAFDLERRQIQKLGLEALVSITDHDCIAAPLLLRNIPSARGIPVSVEWTAPFGATAFHLGIHNLPSADAAAWMERFAHYTAAPEESALQAILEELDAVPQVLTVLNHPIWDLYKIGASRHLAELENFLLRANTLVHAFELNGLRHARENREVIELARTWGQLLISGGDRHGLEANANINLTNATSFSEFVHEIRVHRLSHVLFMEQYARPWEQRILESTLDVITDHSHFSQGWQCWDERAFHPDRDGVMRPFADFWTDCPPPLALNLAVHTVRMFRYQTLAKTLSLLFPRVNGGRLDRESEPRLA